MWRVVSPLKIRYTVDGEVFLSIRYLGPSQKESRKGNLKGKAIPNRYIQVSKRTCEREKAGGGKGGFGWSWKLLVLIR